MNSSMLRPWLSASASRGTMLCWFSGALRTAVGCPCESITRRTGVDGDAVAPAEERAASSAYVNSSASVRGAYELKSTIWKRVRSRVRSTSKVSEAQQFHKYMNEYDQGEECRAALALHYIQDAGPAHFGWT